MIRNYSHYSVIVAEVTDNKQIRPLGTGFVVTENKIVTACHVVRNSRILCVIPSNDIDIYSYQSTKIPDMLCGYVTVEETNPMNDLCILKMQNGSFHGELPVISSLDNVHIGERLGMWGFPHCTMGRRILTYQEMEVGAKMLMGNEIQYKYATVNIQTRPGQSGSLITKTDRGDIVGILLGTYAPKSGISLGGINPFELNQSSYCISAEYIKEML